jgi:hypothetical protein
LSDMIGAFSCRTIVGTFIGGAAFDWRAIQR